MSDRNSGELPRLPGSRPRYSIHQQNCPELRNMRNASYNQAHEETTTTRQQDNRSTSGNAFSATLGRRERAFYIERLEPRFVELVNENERLNSVVNTLQQHDALRVTQVAAMHEEISTLQVALQDAITSRDDRIFNLTTHLQAAQQRSDDLSKDLHQRETEYQALVRQNDRERALRIVAEGRKQVAEHYFPAQHAFPTSTTPAIRSTTPAATPLPPSIAPLHAPAHLPSPTPVSAPSPAVLPVVADHVPQPASSSATHPVDFLPLEEFLAAVDKGQWSFPEVPEPYVPGSGNGNVACALVEAAPTAMPMNAHEVGTTMDAVMETPTPAPAVTSVPVPPLVPTPVAVSSAAAAAAAPPPTQAGMALHGLLRGPGKYSPVTPYRTASQGALEGDDAAGCLFPPPSSHFPPGDNFGD